MGELHAIPNINRKQMMDFILSLFNFSKCCNNAYKSHDVNTIKLEQGTCRTKWYAPGVLLPCAGIMSGYLTSRQIKTNDNFLPFVKSLFDLDGIMFIFAIPTGVMNNLSW
jgi:hypothetical protein